MVLFLHQRRGFGRINWHDLRREGESRPTRSKVLLTKLTQYIGYWFSYALPTITFMLCPLVLWYGRNKYTRSPPTGSVLATALRLWRFAARGRWSLNPVKCYKQLTAADFWENAKPSKIPLEQRPKWMTFDDQWVDEVRRGLKACSVFCWYPVYCKYSCLISSAVIDGDRRAEL